jgi:ABC transporter with metal-binding/Fe-S-binding domain ATP-binding protein
MRIMSDERPLKHGARLAVLYSGGKDSNYALLQAVRSGYEVACLLSIRPPSVESMLFHFPNSHLTGLQAESLGLPLLTRDTLPEGDDLKALRSLVGEAKERFRLAGIVTGAVKSKYQMTRFGEVFESSGLTSFNPLWGADEESYLRRLVKEGFKVIVTRVAALGLGPDWLGVRLDADRVEELIGLARRNRFNASLEGGEGETFVLDMPLFRKEIVVLETERSWGQGEGTLSIKKAILRNKTTDV